ncbi:hypothetical protein, partial [Salmonella sp. s58313]|uniref:hypothetical protein n=1 Tax=Salmonella sp. s58313 TaxID=3160131 RepID=UPI0037540508
MVIQLLILQKEQNVLYQDIPKLPQWFFCGLFPIDADQFEELREALEKLQLNDAALKFEPESSSAMGFG